MVNAILMLPLKAMVEGHGWGCLVCGLASDGAVAVLCDACMQADRQPTFACCGYPGTEGRVPIAELTRPHDHDMTKHPKWERQTPPRRRKWKR